MGINTPDSLRRQIEGVNCNAYGKGCVKGGGRMHMVVPEPMFVPAGSTITVMLMLMLMLMLMGAGRGMCVAVVTTRMACVVMHMLVRVWHGAGCFHEQEGRRALHLRF
ncbi:hypothetical protein AA18895_1947 [Acetobacter ghanensis DSM 18895]|nr:hypothetical protein AA18895_1947 [Acetobacter ghanensis DSM 18895]